MLTLLIPLVRVSADLKTSPYTSLSVWAFTLSAVAHRGCSRRSRSDRFTRSWVDGVQDKPHAAFLLTAGALPERGMRRIDNDADFLHQGGNVYT